MDECMFMNAGYLFCRELLPRDHALQLMLVNTIRKVHLVLHQT
jgi:hypothetical protein